MIFPSRVSIENKMEDICSLCPIVLTKENDAVWNGYTNADTGGEPVCKPCMDKVEKERQVEEKPKNNLKKTSEIAVATTITGRTITFPLQSGEGYTFADTKDAEMNGEIVLSGHDAFHPDVMIRTTKKEINEVIDEMDTMDKAKHYFRQSWDRIKSINTDVLYAEGGKKWKEFLDDIVIYYCARFKLFGKPMPAVHSPEIKEMCAKIGNGDAQLNLSKNEVIKK